MPGLSKKWRESEGNVNGSLLTAPPPSGPYKEKCGRENSQMALKIPALSCPIRTIIHYL